MKTLLVPLVFAVALGVAAPAPALAQSYGQGRGLYLEAPDDGKFLGNLNSNRFDPDSVANPFGRYGSRFSPDSINNPLGRYGSPLSPDSANNPFTMGGPRIRERR